MKALVGAVALGAMLLGASPAQAAGFTFNFQTQFSNTTFPNQPAPWVVGTVDDTTNVTGDLRMTLTGSGLDLNEFVGAFYFNLDDAVDLTQITYNVVNSAGGSFSSIDLGGPTGLRDQYKADGDGYYDMRINMSSNPPRFGEGSTLVIDFGLTGGTLAPIDFVELSLDSGGSGPFYAAMHIQGIATGEGSTWAATGTCPGCGPTPFEEVPSVPEPGSMVLLGTGLLALARGARRRSKRQTVVS